MVHFNHCFILACIYFICIKQIICSPLQSSQPSDKYTISGSQTYLETQMTPADVDYSRTMDLNKMSDMDVQDSDNTGADVNGQYPDEHWSPVKRSERQLRDLRSRFQTGGYSPFIKYSPLKRKLKAGEIVKLLERIAERRGIQVSNKALRYGISRRSVD